MRLLCVSPYYPPYVFGGAEVSTSLLIQNLPKDIKPQVVTSILQKETWKHEHVTVQPLLKVIGLGEKNIKDLISYAIKIIIYPWLNGWILYQYLQKETVDVIHLVPHSYLDVGLVLAIRLTKKPCVLDLRDFTWICLTDFSYENAQYHTKHHSCFTHLQQSYKTHYWLLKPILFIISFYETTLFTLYMKIIQMIVRSKLFIFSALSEYTKNLVAEAGFDSKKITVVPNIINEKTTHSSKIKKPIFTFAGRLEKSKGVWNIIRAFKLAKPKGYQLHLYGTGSELETISQYLQHNKIKNILLKGRQSQQVIMKAYSESYAIISPALRPEPLGRYVLDSFTTQTPLITSNTGGPVEYIVDRKNGLLVNPEDVHLLSTAISLLTENKPLYNSIKKALHIIPEKLKTKSIIAQRVALYKKVYNLNHE